MKLGRRESNPRGLTKWDAQRGRADEQTCRLGFVVDGDELGFVYSLGSVETE